LRTFHAKEDKSIEEDTPYTIGERAKKISSIRKVGSQNLRTEALATASNFNPGETNLGCNSAMGIP
jgi:hypothetical protein